MKKILFAIALVTSTVFIGCNADKSGDPKAVLTQFFDALSKKDMEAARKLATKDSKSMIDMMEMGMNMSKDNKESDKFDKSSMEFGEVKIEGDKATIPVKEKKSGESLNYILKKEEGTWKVAFDKASMMSMGMEKMNEKGINPADSIGNALDELKKLDMDSLKEGMQKGMEMLDTIKAEAEKLKK